MICFLSVGLQAMGEGHVEEEGGVGCTPASQHSGG